RGMRFSEPHVVSSSRPRLKDLLSIAPIAEGLNYVRRDWRLAATMLVKSGLFIIGPSWVVFAVLGERDFPVRWHGLSPQRGGMLGMSFLMGARGAGALLGPMLAAPWAGHRDRRLRIAILFGMMAEALGYFALRGISHLWTACLWIVLAHGGGS